MKLKTFTLHAAIAVLLAPSLQAAAPVNDNFTSATVITGAAGTSAGTNVDATLESGESTFGGKSIWYQWVAPADGTATFDTIGSNFDTKLYIASGAALSSLIILRSDDDGGEDGTSWVSTPVTSGVTYRISVTGYSGESGNTFLNWKFATVAVNDNFAAATVITGASGTIDGDNTVSSVEPGEPSGFSNSVWYSWTAPSSGLMVFHTIGSDRDTDLRLYTGTTINALTSKATNNDWLPGSDSESLVKFSAVIGTTYSIRIGVASYNTPPPGELKLTWLMANQPANDHFANAQAITGASGTVEANTFEATLEDNEYDIFDTPLSLWYVWTAPFTGVVTFDSEGSLAGPSLMVSNTGDMENLNHISDSYDYPSVCTFPVISGNTYRVRLATDVEGTVTLNWSQETEFVPSVISFSAASYTASEAGPSVNITLNRNGGTTTGPVSCYIVSSNGSAGEDDYSGTYTTVNFASGATTASVTIPIYQDRRFEGEESFQLRLFYPSAGTAFGLSLASVYIDDDEPFIPLKANYTALVQSSPYDNALSGTLKINATGNGSFSGSLMMGTTAATPFSGTFNAKGKSTVTLNRKTGGTVLLDLTYGDNGNRIHALVALGSKNADIQARRIIFGGAVEINDKPFTFTAVIKGLYQTPGVVPKADGFLSITVGIKGDVKIAGVLPDDTTFTSSGPIAGYDGYPLYAPLYGGKGSFSSDMTIIEASMDVSATTWTKAANDKDKSFKGGFLQKSELETSPYVYSKRSPILGGVLSTQGAADFFAAGTGLPAEGITQIFRLMEDNSIALPLSPQVKLTLKFTPATGFFTGTFQRTTEKPTIFKGAVLQSLDYASGYYLAPGLNGVLGNGTIDIAPAY